MKTKRTLIILALVGICTVLLWLLFGSKERKSQPNEDSEAVSLVSESGVVNDVIEKEEDQAKIASNPPASLTESNSSQALQGSLERGMARFKEDWKQPISFYGKVVDQNNQPVGDASISFVWNDLSPSGSSNEQTLSDTNGLFALEGRVGRGLSVTVSKEGYYVQRSGTQFDFEYARVYEPTYHRPDPLNPILFRLRKKSQGVELITSQYGIRREMEFSTPRDGTPVRVDFFNRKVGAEGQMELSCIKPSRTENVQVSEWSIRLSIPDGGFIEHNDEFPFEAPESGYQQTFEYRFRVGDTNWTEWFRKEYYIAFGNPRRYGRIKFETRMYWGARLQYAINPTGSRNLEPAWPKPVKRELPPGVREVIPDYAR